MEYRLNTDMDGILIRVGPQAAVYPRPYRRGRVTSSLVRPIPLTTGIAETSARPI
jgi:hypothetical protein